MVARISSRLFEAKRTAVTPRIDLAAEHILLIGSNRLSLLYMKFIRAYSPAAHRIMAAIISYGFSLVFASGFKQLPRS
jgi:hypothetical protein